MKTTILEEGRGETVELALADSLYAGNFNPGVDA